MISLSEKETIMKRRDVLRSLAMAAGCAGGMAYGPVTNAAVAAEATSATAGNVNELVTRYIATWNEPLAERRRELVAKTWTEDGTYTDAHRRGVGHDSIDAMIRTAQERFPGYRLRLVSGIETHNGYLRFSWVLPRRRCIWPARTSRRSPMAVSNR